MSKTTSTARVFVRVRPFTEEEASICPEGSLLPREIIKWDRDNTITILDPQENFTPRKNGVFAVGNVLWSFVDAEANKTAPCTQEEVYRRVVQPAIPAIVEGYSTAFCITGSSSSGRYYTLYGPDLNNESRGILPRFAEDIFAAFEAQKHENSILSVELEAIDVSNDNYIDALAVRRSFNKGESNELKLQNTENGPKLQNVTTVEVKNTADFHMVLMQLMRVEGKRSCSHTVKLLFTETFEFDNPENLEQPIRKSRRVRVLFTLLRSMPSAFQRCVDVAVEHDSGENPLAKVPVRETAFTKLFPDLLQQGYHLNFVTCISPYYEHVREDINTLNFAMKIKRLKGAPKLNEDESLVEMRRLADEVKNLRQAERTQNEAIDVVQQEINAREKELMKQEQYYQAMLKNVHEAQEQARLAAITRSIERARTKRVMGEIKKWIEQQQRAAQLSLKEQNSKEEAKAKVVQAIDALRARAAELENSIIHSNAEAAEIQAKLAEHAEARAQLERLQHFITAAPEEQKQMIIAESETCIQLSARKEKLQSKINQTFEGDDTVARVQQLAPTYERILQDEEPCHERDEILREMSKLEIQTADLEAENARLDNSIKERNSASACSMM